MEIFNRVKRNIGLIGEHSEQIPEYFSFPKLEGEIGPRMQFRGKEKIIWSINNYLGLANDPEIKQVDIQALKHYGLGYPMGARMMSGNSDNHDHLEAELSKFVVKEDTMLLNYGYQGIFSVIDSICSRRDVIVYDSECHASIYDGIRLHLGQRYVYKHNDLMILKVKKTN